MSSEQGGEAREARGAYVDKDEPVPGHGDSGQTGIESAGAEDEYVRKDVATDVPVDVDTGEYDDRDVTGDRPPPREGDYTGSDS